MYDSVLLQLLRRATSDSVLLLLLLQQQQRQAVTRMGLTYLFLLTYLVTYICWCMHMYVVNKTRCIQINVFLFASQRIISTI